MLKFDTEALSDPKTPEDLAALLDEAIEELKRINKHLIDLLQDHV